MNAEPTGFDRRFKRDPTDFSLNPAAAGCGMQPMVSPPADREEFIRAEIARLGPLEAFHALIAENDRQILSSELENGRQLTAERTAIFRALIAHWARARHAEFGYDHPFAVVALGGTGRDEMTPFSDTDFAFLFDDAIEGNRFLMKLQEEVLHTPEKFRSRYGFQGEVLPFNIDDMPELEGKQLNAFVDVSAVYDPDGLTETFRERIQKTYDPFEHFLHVSRFWRDHWGENIAESERLDRFDIKNDGLRVFLAGIWTLAGKEFRHCHEIYDQLEDPRDLAAYHFLLRIRAFVHLRRGAVDRKAAPGDHAEDVLNFEEFNAFGEMLGEAASEREKFEFANVVRERLLEARRRVDRFTWGVMGRELKEGRIIRPGSAIVYGTGGLRDSAAHQRVGNRKKSRAALGVLLAAQRYDLPIDPAEMETTFRDAGDWLEPVPELGELFYESRGSLAESLRFLSQLPGAEDRLFPGYGRFEASLDERIMTERRLLRGGHVRQKIKALESDLAKGLQMLEEARDPDALTDTAYEVSIPIEAALLDTDHLAAVRLALKTKRLPETADDVAARDDDSLPLYDRFSSGLSGIPLSEYYLRSFSGCGFTDETLEIARFLVENRRLFKEVAEADLMDEIQVEKIVHRCDDGEMRLRALFVFTCADRTEWESETEEPARWFNIRELYGKARARYRPEIDPTHKLSVAGYSPDQLAVLQDFGSDFFAGIYRHYAIRFGGYLLRLKDNPQLPPRVTRIMVASSEILAVVTLDHPGIAASISGAFWKNGVGLQQAHLFSSANHGLALDFFHLGPLPTESETELEPGTSLSELSRAIQEAIQEEKFISAEDEASLPDIAENVTLETAASGLFHLRAETVGDVGALIYLLTCKAYRNLEANIYGLAAHTGRDDAWVSVYLGLPDRMPLPQAQEIVRSWQRKRKGDR